MANNEIPNAYRERIGDIIANVLNKYPRHSSLQTLEHKEALCLACEILPVYFYVVLGKRNVSPTVLPGEYSIGEEEVGKVFSYLYKCFLCKNGESIEEGHEANDLIKWVKQKRELAKRIQQQQQQQKKK